jgi:hypothetical protein
MSKPEHPDRQKGSTPDERGDARVGQSATNPPRRRRGGQELPDEVQDRPEQNAGYDEAVESGGPGEPYDDLGIDLKLSGDVTVHDPDEETRPAETSIDDRAERDVIAEVRRRERSSR